MHSYFNGLSKSLLTLGFPLYILTCWSPSIVYAVGLTIVYVLVISAYWITKITFIEPKQCFPKVLPEPPIAKADSNLQNTKNLELVLENYPNLAKETNLLLDLIIETFIISWFDRLTDDANSRFPKIVKEILISIVQKLNSRLQNIDITDLITLKILPLITKHIAMFSIVQETLERKRDFTETDLMYFNLQVAIEYQKRYRLHSSVSLITTNHDKILEEYLRGKSELLMEILMPKDELSSCFVKILIRDIVAANLLHPLLQGLVSAESWNNKLIHISQKVLDERHKIHEIKSSLLEGKDFRKEFVKSLADDSGSVCSELEIGMDFTADQFEEYLKFLSSVKQMSRMRTLFFSVLTNVNQMDKGTLTKKEQLYKNRLLVSLSLIESKMLHVGKQVDINNKSKMTAQPTVVDAMRTTETYQKLLAAIKLDDVIHQPNLLESFEKYLKSLPDQDGKILIEYWEVIEQLKYPLENTNSNDFAITYSQSEASDLRKSLASLFEKNDITSIKALDQGLLNNIILFISCSPDQFETTYFLARKSMILLQHEAEQLLNSIFFQKFKNTSAFSAMVANPTFVQTNFFKSFIHTNPEIVSIGSTSSNSAFQTVWHILSLPSIESSFDSALNKNKNRSNIELKERNELNQNVGHALKQNLFHDTVTSGYYAKDDKNESDSFFSPSKASKPNDTEHTSDVNEMYGEIAKLTMTVNKLQKKLTILDHMILKATLTNDSTQLKLLTKSKKSLNEDLENAELLRQKYMIQQKLASLYGKIKVMIKSYYVASEPVEGKEVTYYLISVDYLTKNGVKTWEIARRFSEFVTLNKYLGLKYGPLVTRLNSGDIFPKKISLSLRHQMSKSLLSENRQKKLETYLQSLIEIREICDDSIFRAFFINTNSFTVKTLSQQASAGDRKHVVKDSSKVTYLDNDHSYENLSQIPWTERSTLDENEAGQEKIMIRSKKPAVKVVCDLFFAIFSFNKSDTSWMRGRAILILMRQLFGGTVDKYVKEQICILTSENKLVEIVSGLKIKFWGSNGYFNKKDRTTEVVELTFSEKTRLALKSQRLFQFLFVELFGKIVGLSTSKDAAVKVHSMLQNPYLNTSLLLTLFDIVIKELENSTD